MKTNGYTIRQEHQNEHRTVEHLVREAFWNFYRPGCYEHFLLHVMRKHPDFVGALNFVMEMNGEIIGQIAFVRSQIALDDGTAFPSLTMGPICIAPQYKRQGWGKKLLDFAFDRAKEMGFHAVCFEGNIDFYGKSGCVPASEHGIRYHGVPAGEDTSFFLIKILTPGCLAGKTGEYSVPTVYFVTDEDVDAFDRDFPRKEKQKLPGQLFSV